MIKIRKCPDCENYTIGEKCIHCGLRTNKLPAFEHAYVIL